MSISSGDESTIIRWLFGEIIYYKNEGKPITNTFRLGWANNLRFQKIIFNVAEEQNLPITRSWYLWGGYIHSPIMEPVGFETHKIRYSADPRRVENLRTEIRHLGIDTSEIIEEVKKQTEYFTSSDSRTFLPSYYEEKTPALYKALYLSKQYLNDILYDLSRINSYEENIFYNIREDYHKQYYDFNKTSQEVLDQTNINNNKDIFYTIINTALDKIEVHVIKKMNIGASILSYFSEVYTVYKEFVWRPFASRVSQNTITGVRATTERRNMAEKEYYSIINGNEQIRRLNFRLERENMEPTYDEYRLLNSKTSIDEEVRNAIGDLFRIYRRNEEDEKL